MSEPTFIEEPTRPQWFEAELKSFDELLEVHWHAREWPERGETACWRVMRRVPNREVGWMQQAGIWRQVERTRSEHVLDWPAVEEDGTPRRLDRRLFDKLASCDPARHGHTRWQGFERMMAERAVAHEKREREDQERTAGEIEEAVAKM